MKRIAIFASGSGTNAEAICKYLRETNRGEVVMMICNRREAGVYDRMKQFDVPCHFYGKAEWTEADGQNVIKLLKDNNVDLVVLAGFLAVVPSGLLKAYEGRIINIHPALLPRHGGKGMWGHHVHQAVLDEGDKQSGITIHKVTDVVDGGEIIFQASCPVEPDDTPDTLAARVHQLEHAHFPRVVAEYLESLA